jgi:hypothetical protein
LANTLATVTFSANPNIAAGDEIKVENVNPVLNGTYSVASISGNTVSYTASGVTGDISSFNVPRGAKVTVVNSVTEAPTYTAVTSLPAGGSDYNVPGNMNYNSDNAIDNIIASDENPS